MCVEDAKQTHTYAECSADSTSVRYICSWQLLACDFHSIRARASHSALSLIANRQSLIASHSYDRLASARQIPLPPSLSLTAFLFLSAQKCQRATAATISSTPTKLLHFVAARAYNSKVVGYCISKMYLYLCLHLLYLYLLLSPLLLLVAVACCCLARMSRGACLPPSDALSVRCAWLNNLKLWHKHVLLFPA